MLEPQNNEALKIETARRRTGLIRQYPGIGPVEIVADMAAHELGFLRCCSNVASTQYFGVWGNSSESPNPKISKKIPY